MGCAESGLAKAVYEGPQRLVLFLSDAKERVGCGLMWATTSEMSSKHVGEGVKAVNGIRRESNKPFKGRAFEGSWKSFAEDDIMGRIEGDVGYVYCEVLVWVGFSCITIQREGFPLARRGCW